MTGLCRGRPAAAVLCSLVAACALAAPAGAEALPKAPAEPPPKRPEPTAKDLRTTDKVRAADAKRDGYKSPTCIAFSRDGQTAYVTCHTADTLVGIDAKAGEVLGEVPVGRAPTGVAVAPDGKTVYVAGTLDHTVSVVDTGARKVVATIPCGYEPTGLALSRDGKRLYPANFISDDVSVIDTQGRKEVKRIGVGKGPTYLDLTPDGKRLVVNHLYSRQPATDPTQTAHVAIIDTDAGKVVAKRTSPGTMLLGMGLAVSPDGKWALAVHSRPNFNITPSQLNQGWVHTNALSLVPLADEKAPVQTVLLDNVSSGAANPHGVAVSKDGATLYVSHRGIHQVSVIDLPRLRWLLEHRDASAPPPHVHLGFLWRHGKTVRRVASGGKGPNGLAVSPADGSVWVANYFSDNVAVLDAAGVLKKRIDLGGPKQMTEVRRGEFLFHDAAHCFQQWVSCTSCHPGVRADGVNWDLLNDGISNHKNAKSLVGAHLTPPSMALGVRASMEVAAEKGFLFIQFIVPKPDELKAVQAYLRTVPFRPSPFHRKKDGSLDDQASRGKAVFGKAGCAVCHPEPLYTTCRFYDVGTFVPRDYPEEKPFDTPTLLEAYRTAPYMHDGRAATLEEVVTTCNPDDRHGRTSNLSKQEIADLVAFMMAL